MAVHRKLMLFADLQKCLDSLRVSSSHDNFVGVDVLQSLGSNVGSTAGNVILKSKHVRHN